MKEKKLYLTGKILYVFSFFWFILITVFFFKNWSPLKLFFNQGAIIPQDIFASFYNLFLYGLQDFAFLSLIIFAAFGAGFAILHLFRLELDFGQKLTISFAAGLGVLSYIVLFLGLVGGYNRNGLLIIFLLIGIFAFVGIKNFIKYRSYFPTRIKSFQKILFIVILIIEGIFLLSKALKPAIFYDAITYHLGVPNYYLLEGGIKYLPYDSCSNFPFLAEMLYVLGLFISGLKLAQMTSVLVFLACALTVYDFTRVFLKETNPALAGLLFLSIPAFIENSNLYTNDLHLAYFALIAIYCLFLWREKGGYRYLALLGIFTGFCLATKYIALISIIVPFSAAMIYFLVKDRKPFKEWAKVFALFLLPAFAVFSPWAIKNYIFTGNPFYPAFLISSAARIWMQRCMRLSSR